MQHRLFRSSALLCALLLVLLAGPVAPRGAHAAPADAVSTATPPRAPAVPSAPLARRLLTGQLPAGTGILGFKISADGEQHVVYLADPPPAGGWELYSVPFAGGVSARISVDPPPGEEVVSPLDGPGALQTSPNGQRAVYLLGAPYSGDYDLYSVPVAGAQASNVKLNQGLDPAASVKDMAISPDSARVVYETLTGTTFAIYTVPIDGSAASSPLVADLPAGREIRQMAISADGSRVVYVADRNTAGRFELYSVPLAGGTSTKLNASLGGTQQLDDFVLAGSQAVYQVEDSTTIELFRVPVAGPANSSVPVGCPIDSTDYFMYRKLPAGTTRLIYQVLDPVNTTATLYSALLSGPGDPCLALTSTLAGPAQGLGTFSATAAGRVVYHYLGQTQEHLYSVPAGGPADSAVTLEQDDLRGADAHRISASEAAVAYAGNDAGGTANLYAVPILGPTSARVWLSGPGLSLALDAVDQWGNSLAIAYGLDDSHLVFMARTTTADRTLGLYAVDGAWWSQQLFLPSVIQ